jgi:hypothetical protein
MADRTVTLTLPEPLYSTFERRAEQAHRSVEEELLAALATSLPVDEGIPAVLHQELAALATLDDSALWQVARHNLDQAAARRLPALIRKRQRRGLTETEQQKLVMLLEEYDRLLLTRAEAAALLRRRGHDVSDLVSSA